MEIPPGPNSSHRILEKLAPKLRSHMAGGKEIEPEIMALTEWIEQGLAGSKNDFLEPVVKQREEEIATWLKKFGLEKELEDFQNMMSRTWIPNQEKGRVIETIESHRETIDDDIVEVVWNTEESEDNSSGGFPPKARN